MSVFKGRGAVYVHMLELFMLRLRSPIEHIMAMREMARACQLCRFMITLNGKCLLSTQGGGKGGT